MVVVVLVPAGRVVTADSRTVVVLVVGVGVSTTVVHEVRTVAATASAGARMRSFFIVKWLFHHQFETEPLVSRMPGEFFRGLDKRHFPAEALEA